MRNTPDARRQLRKEWSLNLYEAMRRRRVSRADLRALLEAEGVEVTEQAIGGWLRAETSPRIEYQAAIASALKTPVRKLFPVELAEAVA